MEQKASTKRSSKTSDKIRTSSVLLFVLSLILFLPSTSKGFQFFFFFEGPSSTGEGGMRYFTGSPRWKLYDCRICHVHTPGKIGVNLGTEPTDIFRNGYQPGETYTIRLELEEETRAPARKLFSTNNFASEVLDASGRNVGVFYLGFPSNPISQLLFDPVVLSPDGTVVLSGFFNMDLAWEWFWTAPGLGSGELIFYLGFVDGNGDIKSFSDDVAILKKRTFERP